MAKGISKPVGAHELEPVSLSDLIHQHVRAAIEVAVHEELRAALGTSPYERSEGRRGYRNGSRERTLTGPTGPVALALPRATFFRGTSAKEWTSTIVPRYQRRMPAVKAAPLSKSAVSRVIATLKDGLEAWRTRSLAHLDIIYVYTVTSQVTISARRATARSPIVFHGVGEADEAVDPELASARPRNSSGVSSDLDLLIRIGSWRAAVR